jgi:hypothetical protein
VKTAASTVPQGTDENLGSTASREARKLFGRSHSAERVQRKLNRIIPAHPKDTLFSRWGMAPEPATVKIDPSVDMKTPPKIQVDTMPLLFCSD